MLEITKKQLLSFDDINKARIMKYIVLGIIKLKESNFKEKSNIKKLRKAKDI